MSTKLLVKNINKSASNEQLAQKIREIVPVKSVRIHTDKVTFQSKGVAEVEAFSDEEGHKILTELNGHRFMGQDLEISHQVA